MIETATATDRALERRVGNALPRLRSGKGVKKGSRLRLPLGKEGEHERVGRRT